MLDDRCLELSADTNTQRAAYHEGNGGEEEEEEEEEGGKVIQKKKKKEKERMDVRSNSPTLSAVASGSASVNT